MTDANAPGFNFEQHVIDKLDELSKEMEELAIQLKMNITDLTKQLTQ